MDSAIALYGAFLSSKSNFLTNISFSATKKLPRIKKLAMELFATKFQSQSMYFATTMPTNQQSKKTTDSTALGEFLRDSEKDTHDLLRISLNLEMNDEQSNLFSAKRRG